MTLKPSYTLITSLNYAPGMDEYPYFSVVLCRFRSNSGTVPHTNAGVCSFRSTGLALEIYTSGIQLRVREI